MIRFNQYYFIPAILLLITEVLIALFVHDKFVRPYFGDFLVVILMYCFVRSFLNISGLKVGLGVLLFSYGIETLQYLNFVKQLGFENSRLGNVILGNSFEWVDILAYTLGIVMVLIIEKRKS
ncbi:MAG: DUF2809 domain-containing protein [Bacteroidia bacterium]